MLTDGGADGIVIYRDGIKGFFEYVNVKIVVLKHFDIFKYIEIIILYMAIENNDESCDVCCSVEDLIKTLPADKTLEDNAAVLKSLADPTRLKIIYLLKNGELCVCQILEAIDKSQSTISHHLNMMKKEKILSARKQGKWIYYKLAKENIINCLEEIF